jgi:hypothetical protein
MAQRFESIQTAAGLISGLDAFFLDNIHCDYQGTTVELVGEINGHLCSRNERRGPGQLGR